MFVYLTYCRLNNKKYIGKYEGSEEDKYLGSGKLLTRALTKYGTNAFERIILERYKNSRECSLGEKKWIELFDAVNRSDFYNIASGGDGGNTYAGIEGKDRVLLVAKLRTRRKRSSPKGMIAYRDLFSGKTGSCDLVTYQNNPLFIGIKAKYLYVTPLGTFSSLKVANSFLGIDMETLSRRCIGNSKKISRKNLSSSNHKLTEHDTLYLGQTFEAAGYSCIAVKEVLNYTAESKHKLKIVK